ncbi:MAG: DNA internalization-related competence protein ComEC/Rec2 [Gammaproteobacteria bacterium]|nr:DNA internalization-related competence protein ComEC/Rec2 [Gammaproteobacteria bacterium]MCI0590176.1 DNA internalization-related competence protein ComEC/Rec2 [Gammaproteobacteria bacterium]
MRLGTLAFLLGILACIHLTSLPDSHLIYLMPVGVGLVLFTPRLRLSAFFLCGFLWALFRADLILSSALLKAIEGQTVVVTGTVASLPVQRGGAVRFEFDVEGLAFDGQSWTPPGRVRLNWDDRSALLSPGEHWQLAVRMKRPYGFMNPGGFDYEGWLFRENIRATGYVVNNPANQRLNTPPAVSLERVRHRLWQAIKAAMGDAPETSMIGALAIGVQDEILPSQWQVLNRTGTSHLISISGLHVGLVAGLVFFLASWLWSLFGVTVQYMAAPRFGAIAGLLAALVYSALAGLSIPTQRSLVMVAVVMAGVLAHRRVAPLDLLILALLAVLIIDPFAVLSVGFWLSFVAVAVIIYGMSGRTHAQGIWWRWGRVQWLVAVGLLPLLIVWFQQYPLMGMLANLVAVPWVSFIVVPIVLVGTLTIVPFNALGTALLISSGYTLGWLWPYLHWLSKVDFATWHQSAPLPWALSASVMGVAILLLPKGVPARWVGLVWLLPLIFSGRGRPAEGELWFTLLDVGQGLAAVARTRDHVLVYDTGARFSARFNAGSAVVVPYLRYYGINELDILVVSHGDNDHIGGAKSLLEQIPVGLILTSVPNRLKHKHITYCVDGQSWRWNGVDFAIIHPPDRSQRSANNRSCVLKISTSGGTVLLSGDIQARAERRLLKSHPEIAETNILIAPHHGSKTSSSPQFIDTVSPDYVLFPVGYRNRFRFPKADIIERYRQRDVRMLDTARDGAIRFKLNERVSIPETYREAERRFWHTRY